MQTKSPSLTKKCIVSISLLVKPNSEPQKYGNAFNASQPLSKFQLVKSRSLIYFSENLYQLLVNFY